MGSVTSALAVASALCGFCAPLAAQSLAGGELRRNGEVSRHVFIPSATQGLADDRMSAGLAFGLKGALRQQMGAVAPMLTMDVTARSKLLLLSAPGKGAMVVLQTPTW